MTRREAREQAFLLLFEWSFRQDETMEEVIELARHCRNAEIDVFANEIAEKAVEHVLWIDREIEKHSVRWKLNRLSKVTLSVLRMGICEMTYLQDIPVGATINEAVELMKQYATADEAGYVNGVLGAYGRAQPEPESEAAPELESVPEPESELEPELEPQPLESEN